MAAPEGDVTVVESKPSRLAPLKKSTTSKASVETFFRVPGHPPPPRPRRAAARTARDCPVRTRRRGSLAVRLAPGLPRGSAARGAVRV